MHSPARKWRLLIWLLIATVLVVILLIAVPLLNPTCRALIVHSGDDPAIPLPANCSRVSRVATDDMVRYLGKERNRRGLVFKEWITCNPAGQTHRAKFAFADDPRWLPSYVPNTYQFRRTVVILPYGPDVPRGSPVAAELAWMPWPKYLSQILGESNGKFSRWK